MLAIDRVEALFLQALRCAVHGNGASFEKPLSQSEWDQLWILCSQQRVVPLVAQALFPGDAFSDLPGTWDAFRLDARKRTISQAARTADFLLLLDDLDRRGLRPAVLKGIVCRRLYQNPEQRVSNDEDLLIAQEELPAYHEALLACGLQRRDPEENPEGEYEVTYVDPERQLYLELHYELFDTTSESLGNCGRIFDGALARTTEISVYGQSIRTLQPTDHLLYMLCHAYKHLLFGGFGVRQICDICMFAQKEAADIDFERVRRDCTAVGIETLAAAVFRIGENFLDMPGPAAFADLDPDELPLLKDCLTGGLYGADDPDRVHSSRITLEAVAADKQGRRRHGLLRSLFPGAEYLRKTFPYLKEQPWLLPVAWGQRLLRYASDRRTSAGKSLAIGRERVELLRRYNLTK